MTGMISLQFILLIYTLITFNLVALTKTANLRFWMLYVEQYFVCLFVHWHEKNYVTDINLDYLAWIIWRAELCLTSYPLGAIYKIVMRSCAHKLVKRSKWIKLDFVQEAIVLCTVDVQYTGNLVRSHLNQTRTYILHSLWLNIQYNYGYPVGSTQQWAKHTISTCNTRCSHTCFMLCEDLMPENTSTKRLESPIGKQGNICYS